MVSVVQKPCTRLMTNLWQRKHETEPQISQFPSSTSRHTSVPSTKLYAALKKTPRGFNPNPKRTKKTKQTNKDSNNNSNDEQDTEEEDPTEGVIPEVVTNRMINRMGLTVGVPLFIGLLFFPFFYYLKVGLKIDFPSWIPYIFSFFFFGSALLGISYGIVSTSWDPLREGSLLGWNEAQKNWPVFWQSLRGKK